MCRIAVIVNVTPETEKLAWKFSRELTPQLTKAGNHDGFGYMALSDNGIFGERWLNPKQAWKLRDNHSASEKTMIDNYQGVLKGESSYTNFGSRSGNTTSIALHARMSTNNISMANTHPFISDDSKTAMIHNGIVDATVLDLRTSTCDSEGIINAYTDIDVTHNPEFISRVTSQLNGYYACAVLAESDTGMFYLDIFKDQRANLYAVYVDKLKSVVFATDPMHVVEVCRKLKLKHSKPLKVEGDSYIRHNAKTGEVISVAETVPYIAPYEKYKSNVRWESEEETALMNSDPFYVKAG